MVKQKWGKGGVSSHVCILYSVTNMRNLSFSFNQVILESFKKFSQVRLADALLVGHRDC